MTTESTIESDATADDDVSAFRLSCGSCEWDARVPADGDRTNVSDKAANHFLETGHTPIKQR